MTVQISRPRPPAARPAPAGPLSRRERAVIEDIAVFAVVASIGWHFAGAAAAGLGLIAASAGLLTRAFAGALTRRARPRTVVSVLVGLTALGVLTGFAASTLGWSWTAVAGWSLAVAGLIAIVRFGRRRAQARPA